MNETQPPASRPSRTIHVRLPIGMYQQVAKLATQEHRSLNKEILTLLRLRLLAQASEHQAEAPPTSSGRADAESLARTRGGTDAATCA